MSWIITGTQKNSFTPADITTALWLDAADASTITESGGVVSQWDDKSGNARNFSATSTARPAYTLAGQNGKNVLTFDGIDDFMSLGSSYIYGTTHSLFIVAKYTAASSITASTPGAGIFRGSVNDSALYVGPWSGAFSNERLGYYVGSSGFAKTDADIDTTLPLLLGFANQNNYATAVRRLNGGNDFATTNGITTPSEIHYIGSFSPSSNFWTGTICEFIITPSYLTLAVLEKVEGYLAHKWGLTANLPADHPYKTAVPVP